MNHYGVIMAGGGGTRFWPLSRQKAPKQLLNLSGRGLMVNEAAERMALVIGKSQIFVVTAEAQAPAMAAATQGIVFPRNILAEPAARNTAPCIGYAAMEICRKYGDGVMVIMPADHCIRDPEALAGVLRAAMAAAEESGRLVTIGVKPASPSTAYGYIKYDAAAPGPVKPALAFREKPDEETAKRYVADGSYAWNSGMFIWKASLILEKLKEHAPDLYEGLSRIGDAMNTPAEQEVLHEVYPSLRNISIDYVVMEPCAARGDVLVIPGEFGWSDMGSWDMLDVLQSPDERGNLLFGDAAAVDTKDVVIWSSGRAVTAVDVENIVIVETADAVMVCRRDKAQNVKKIVDALQEAGRQELL